MLRQLRFDFYKITKSKVIGWCFIIPLLILLIGSANTYIINTSAMSTISNLRAVSGNMHIALYVVGIVFITSDFSSGYIKNVYQFSNKLQYLLSKVIYVFIFCVLFLGLEFLIGWLFNTIWGNETLFEPEYDDVKAYIYTMIAELLNGVALGIFLCFLSLSIFKFTHKIPRQTRTSAIIVSHNCCERCSLRIIDDNTNPKTGVIKPKTETLETSLYLSKIPQIVYAQAERSAR